MKTHVYASVAEKVIFVSGREFTIDKGDRKMIAETMTPGYDPLDSEDYPGMDAGERISFLPATSMLIAGKRELMAESVITLSDSPGSCH